MLWDLHVKDLAVIDELRLNFGKGLTVLSGDEGAGKSLLVDALCLLAGGKAATSLIRNGASRVVVEGVFDIQAENEELASLLECNGIEIEADATLIISREVHEQGRSIARVNGRAVPVSLLRELGQQLIDIHSQTEHLSLLNPHYQMDLLDRYGGLMTLRHELAAKIGEFRRVSNEISLLAKNNSAQECDLLSYQIAEIDKATIQPGEDEALEQEHRVLQGAQEIKEYCHDAYSKLNADDCSAILLLNQAVKALERMTLIDPTLLPQVENIVAVTAELEEIARTLNAYLDRVNDSPERLQQVEERLALIYQLKRKYGATLEQILESFQEARDRLNSIETMAERRQELVQERIQLQTEAGELAEQLSKAREEAAAGLNNVVNAELAEMGIPWASFSINLVREEAEDGVPAYNSRYSFTQHGIERVHFMASTNPGEPLRPLADIVSGGETCRFMLALKSALRQDDFIPTLIFDEIDSGVGGRNANTVGKKLAALAQNRQVICITHLPQIACFGKNHYQIIKEIGLTHAVTSVKHLKGNHRVQELAAMLGGTKKPMLESAQELLIGAKD